MLTAENNSDFSDEPLSKRFSLSYSLKNLMSKLYSIFLRGALLCAALLFGAVTNAQAGYLYALNDSSAGNNIYGYSVNEATGAPVALAGFPVATGGIGADMTASEQLTVDRANNRLYVVNAGSGTISAYSINTTNGALTALPFSPIQLPSGLYVTIAVHPSGSPLVAGDIVSSLSASYVITPTTATAAAGSPFSIGAATPLSSVFSRSGNFFYTGGGFGNNFAGFSVNAANGVLTALAGSPFNSGSGNPVGYATDSQDRLFLANQSANQLRVFTTASGIPSAATGNPFASGLAQAADGALSPNERFYLVADRSGNRVGAYQIAGTGAATTLTAVGSPVASSGTSTVALVFNQTGTFVFAANGDSRNITTYNFNQTNGALAFNNVQAANALGAAGILTGIDYLPTGVPTAATVTISGRVTVRKRGVARASILLTGADGQTRRAMTNSFGYYRFEDVSVGETYIFDVRSKQYTFATQVLSVTEELDNLNFEGN